LEILTSRNSQIEFGSQSTAVENITLEYHHNYYHDVSDILLSRQRKNKISDKLFCWVIFKFISQRKGINGNRKAMSVHKCQYINFIKYLSAFDKDSEETSDTWNGADEE
jgi:hypothetical protein